MRRPVGAANVRITARPATSFPVRSRFVVRVQALSHALRRKYGNVPFLTLDYDGFVDSGRDSRLASFLAQVKERRAGRTAG